MPFIELENGIKINYQLEGKENGDLLLLIHGYGSWLQGYDEIVTFLIKKYLVLRSDLRGHGDSEKPLVKDNYEETKKLYTIEQFADDNYLLLKKLGLLEKYTKISLYGHSMGGMISQVFALKYPHIVKRLILGSTAAIMDSPGLRMVLNDYKSGKLEISREGFIFTAQLGYTYRFKKNHPELLEKEVEAKLKCAPEVIIAAMENFIHNFNVKEKLKTLNLPVLILSGDKDSLISPKNSLELNNLIPNSKLVIFKKQNHGINVEITEKVVNEIINFIED